MGRRSSSLNNYTGTAITREIDSKYDVVKEVSEHLDSIESVASEDLAALTAALEEAKDFTGITVVSGEAANWDAVGKVLTVPTVKGDTGDEGAKGDTGETGADGAEGPRGIQGARGEIGAAGINGLDGQTPEVVFSYDSVTGDLEYEVTYVNGTVDKDEEW